MKVERGLSNMLRDRPAGLVSFGIDIPIGLIDDSRECDLKAGIAGQTAKQ